MKTYSYSLNTDQPTLSFDQEICEFVEAENITDAYNKVITIIADLNKIAVEYKWTLKSLRNCYFVGLDGKNNYHECKCQCDNAECDCV